MGEGIDAVLSERGGTHGAFKDNAAGAQRIKDILRDGENWRRMSDVQRESLDMIAHKIARILSGNPFYRDHWVDIAGYAKLAALTLADSVNITIARCYATNSIISFCEGRKNYLNMPNEIKVPLVRIILALGHISAYDCRNRFLWSEIGESANQALNFCEKIPDEQSFSIR